MGVIMPETKTGLKDLIMGATTPGQITALKSLIESKQSLLKLLEELQRDSDKYLIRLAKPRAKPPTPPITATLKAMGGAFGRSQYPVSEKGGVFSAPKGTGTALLKPPPPQPFDAKFMKPPVGPPLKKPPLPPGINAMAALFNQGAISPIVQTPKKPPGQVKIPAALLKQGVVSPKAKPPSAPLQFGGPIGKQKIADLDTEALPTFTDALKEIMSRMPKAPPGVALAGKVFKGMGKIGWKVMSKSFKLLAKTPFKLMGKALKGIGGTLSSLGSSIMDGFLGPLSIFSEIFEGIGGMLGSALIPIIMDILKFLTPLIVQLGELTSNMTDLPSFLKDVLILIIDTVVDMIPTLLEVIIGIVPVLLPLLMDVLKSILDMLVANLPLIIGVILELIPMIIEFLAEAVPLIIDALIALLPDLIAVIVDTVPTIIEALVEALPTIVDALMVAFPTIITALTTQILPMLIAQVPILLGMIITQVIPSLFTGLVEMFKALLTGLWDALRHPFKKGADTMVEDTQVMWDQIHGITKTTVEDIQAMGGATGRASTKGGNVGIRL